MEKQKAKLIEVNKNVSPSIDISKNQTEKKLPVTKEAQSKIESAGLTQREAVFTEVMKLITEEKMIVTSSQAIKPLLTEIHFKKICSALVVGFQSKKIALKDTESNRKKLADSKALELYCLGLLNNWLRRDKRLNGISDSKK